MIEIHTTTEPLSEMAHALKKIILENQSKDILFLFSGGSALALIDHIHPKMFTPHHTITVLDERYTFDEDESNFSKLARTFFAKEVRTQGVSFIDPRPNEGETLEATAKRFDLALKQWHIFHTDGVVVATLGIGPDGHTAGILPYPEDPKTFSSLFLNKKVCVVGYETTPEKNPYTQRITTTLAYLLHHVHHTLVYVSGKPKHEITQKALNSKEQYAVLPATVLQNMYDVHLYSDMSIR